MILRPTIFSGIPGVVAAMSTRHGGISPPPFGMNLSFQVGDNETNVVRNRELFFGGLGINLQEIAVPRQVHGTTVRAADSPGNFPETDGLITTSPGVFLCVTVADCVPVLLADPLTGALAAVHAGWRGTAAGIVAVAVDMMKDMFGVQPGHLTAYLGPSAASCCYAVGEEVAALFEPTFLQRRDGNVLVDLKAANLHSLLHAGVRPEHVETSPFCTISDGDRFHSHRREGVKSGRMMAVIGRRSPG